MGKAIDYIRLGRPHQLVKNAFVFTPLFFGGGLIDTHALVRAIAIFSLFCLASMGVYAFNDWSDIESDRRHPRKRHRPLAAGRIPPSHALVAAVTAITVSLGLAAVFSDRAAAWTLAAYVLMNFCYSLKLKHILGVDILTIAVGFVLRVVAGGAATGIHVSYWMIAITFELSLLLALTKRFGDLVPTDDGNTTDQRALGYRPEILARLIRMLAMACFLTYALFTVTPTAAAYYQSGYVWLTSAWVGLGILRYLRVATAKGADISPTQIVLGDRLLQGIILAWVLHFYLLLYLREQLH
jgi:4-hydroxybenzoate polyprenyltransferase